MVRLICETLTRGRYRPLQGYPRAPRKNQVDFLLGRLSDHKVIHKSRLLYTAVIQAQDLGVLEHLVQLG